MLLFKLSVENKKHPNFEWRGGGRVVDCFALLSCLIWGQSLNSFIADCSFWPSLLLKLENHIAENVIAGLSLTELSICQNWPASEFPSKIMRISFLIKTNHPDLSNSKYYAKRGWFFSKTSWKKPISLPKCLVWPWSGRPLLTFGKCSKILSCQGDAVSRQGIEQLGRSFGSILLLLFVVSY